MKISAKMIIKSFNFQRLQMNNVGSIFKKSDNLEVYLVSTYFYHYWGQMGVEKIYMTKEPWQHSKIQKQDFYDEVRSNCNSN